MLRRGVTLAAHIWDGANKSMTEQKLIRRFQGSGIWVINHYSGCSIRCQYAPCAPSAAPKMEADVLTDCLAADLSAVPKDETIWIGAQVDPYQQIETKLELTKTILEFFATHAHRINIITKSDLILRDIDLLKQNEIGRVYFSICTLDDRWAAGAEPGCAPPSRRADVVRQLASLDIPVGIKIQPFIPGVSDVRQIVNAFMDLGDEVCFESRPLHIRPECREFFASQFGDDFTQDYAIQEYEKGQQKNSDLEGFRWKPYVAF